MEYGAIYRSWIAFHPVLNLSFIVQTNARISEPWGTETSPVIQSTLMDDSLQYAVERLLQRCTNRQENEPYRFTPYIESWHAARIQWVENCVNSVFSPRLPPLGTACLVPERRR